MGKARRAGRNRKTPVTVADSPWDHGASGKANQAGLIEEKRGDIDPDTGQVVNPNGVTGKRRVDMLEIYYKRGWISAGGYNAGELLRHSWLQTEKGACAPWLRERVDSSPKPDAAIAIQIDRMSALVAIGQLVHPEDREIIDVVCRQGAGIGHLRQYRGRHHDEGKEHLNLALDRLHKRIEGLRGKLR